MPTGRPCTTGCASTSNGTASTISNYSNGIWLFLALVVVFIVYQGLLGASLGKLAMGLRIVKSDGSLAGIGPSAIRTVLWVVDAITCGLPVVGGILMLTTTGHRRVGDMGAGTYVVPQAQVGHPVILPGQPGWGTYQQVGPPLGAYPMGQPGQPPMGPPAAQAPWAPTTPGGPQTTPPTTPGGPPTAPPMAPPTAPSAGSADYEADKPIWDDARHAYIQYDSARGAWLEFDDRVQQWKPIST